MQLIKIEVCLKKNYLLKSELNKKGGIRTYYVPYIQKAEALIDFLLHEK